MGHGLDSDPARSGSWDWRQARHSNPRGRVFHRAPITFEVTGKKDAIRDGVPGPVIGDDARNSRARNRGSPAKRLDNHAVHKIVLILSGVVDVAASRLWKSVRSPRPVRFRAGCDRVENPRPCLWVRSKRRSQGFIGWICPHSRQPLPSGCPQAGIAADVRCSRLD